MGPLATLAICRIIHGRLRVHEMGRHQTAEIAMLGERAVTPVGEIIGGQTVLFGEQPDEADAALFGLLPPLLAPRSASLAHDGLERPANLLAHRDRMLTMFYPEYVEPSAVPATPRPAASATR